jgi:hypothetical protein
MSVIDNDEKVKLPHKLQLVKIYPPTLFRTVTVVSSGYT